MAPLGVLFHLLVEDRGLVLSAILVPFDSNQFMLCPWAMSFFQKLCPAPFSPVTVVVVVGGGCVCVCVCVQSEAGSGNSHHFPVTVSST